MIFGPHQKHRHDEATALFLGKDPLRVRWDDLRQLRSDSIFVAQYQRLRNQLLRAKLDDRLADGDPPRKFVEFATTIGFALPARLYEMQGVPAEKSQGDLVGKRRMSALLLIIGMAVKKYKYVPGSRSSVPREIADDLNGLGLSISDDTVRTFLVEACESVDLTELKK